MKKVLLLSIAAMFSLTLLGQTTISDSVLIEKLNTIELNQINLDKKISHLSNVTNEHKGQLKTLKKSNEVLSESINDLRKTNANLQDAQTSDRQIFEGKIKDTNKIVNDNQVIVENQAVWGLAISITLLLVLLIVFFVLRKHINKGVSSVGEVRKAQEALQKAQLKMQEESVQLDSKMIELCEKQLSFKDATSEAKPDHSLALKIADEIVRIELNLSRMDTSIKGYKPLNKAVQRMKDNFLANGYEIVDMLGKPYNPGMKVIASFVTDENLKENEQIITKIIKPQINFQQKMIQAAQIEVSQSE